MFCSEDRSLPTQFGVLRKNCLDRNPSVIHLCRSDFCGTSQFVQLLVVPERTQTALSCPVCQKVNSRAGTPVLNLSIFWNRAPMHYTLKNQMVKSYYLRNSKAYKLFLTLPIADFIGLSYLFLISFGTQVTCTYITWLPQLIEIRPVTTRPKRHVLEASIKISKEILCWKHTRLYILHTKWGLVVKGHLAPLCMFFSYLKNQLYIFQTVWNSSPGSLQADVSIEYVIAPLSLTESVFM